METGQQYGKYVLLKRIAHGGMAEVFKAKSLGVDGFEKPVAIKRLHAHYAQDDSLITMLKDEARLCSQLNHENICQVMDLGRVQDTYYIAMEFVDGRDLATVMRRAHEKLHRALPFPATLYIMREMLKGLDYAHRKKGADGKHLNIIHRDISPQNVLIGYEGAVKIIDFGIAKAKGRSQQTEAGIIKGKFRYMSPEQARGETLDYRTDIYASGLVMYELILGRPHSWGLTDRQILFRVQSAEIEPLSSLLPDIPPDLELIVERALARDPENRYPSARLFAQAIDDHVRQNGLDFDRDSMAMVLRELFPESWQSTTRIDEINTIEPGDLVLDSDPGMTRELSADQILEVGSQVSPQTSMGRPAKSSPRSHPAFAAGHRTEPGPSAERASAHLPPLPLPGGSKGSPRQPSFIRPARLLKDPEGPRIGDELFKEEPKEAPPVAAPSVFSASKSQEVLHTDPDERIPSHHAAAKGKTEPAKPKEPSERKLAAGILYFLAAVVILGGGGFIIYTLQKSDATGKAPSTKPAANNNEETAPQAQAVRVLVDIKTKPRKGAEIIINGTLMDKKTPAHFELTAKSPITLELRHKGYPRWINQFPFEAGDKLTIEADLRKPPKQAVAASVDDVDLKEIGRSKRGRRTHGASSRGADQKGRIIVPGKETLLESKNLATLEISCDERAHVYINGRMLGSTKLIKRLRPGTYTVWVKKRDKTSKSKVVRLAAGETKQLRFYLAY